MSEREHPHTNFSRRDAFGRTSFVCMWRLDYAIFMKDTTAVADGCYIMTAELGLLRWKLGVKSWFYGHAKLLEK